MTDIKQIRIGRWSVYFIFSLEGYDIDYIIKFMEKKDAPDAVLDQSYKLMSRNAYDTGFTYTDEYTKIAIVAIGKQSSDKEFLNTFVHEIHHLSVAIAESFGVDLEGETPAYISGSLSYGLAEYLYGIGCRWDNV